MILRTAEKYKCVIHCYGFILLMIFSLSSCSKDHKIGFYDFKIDFGDYNLEGTMKVKKNNKDMEFIFVSNEFDNIVLKNYIVRGDEVSGKLNFWGEEFALTGNFTDLTFLGVLSGKEGDFEFNANKQSDGAIKIDRSNIAYLIDMADLQDSEKNIDHAGIIEDLGGSAMDRGERLYNSNCINCHGNADVEGSIPLSTKFWEEKFKAGSDAYSMYQTVTRGFGSMPPQMTLTPQEKYDVIHFIREGFIKKQNPEEYIQSTYTYLNGVPSGTSRGPEVKPYHPWSDMNYGNFLMNTYELVDEETGPERYHSPGPSPFPDEDYSTNNFAYKGIAVRLDHGDGGVSKGNSWMIFDHDLMRVSGGWTGEGFIDWNAILLNDRHETYPRTIGKLHFETPVGPGWANPENGKFDDPRFIARDGRKFGPLPKNWADYKGLYHHEDHIIISYSVGKSNVLESLGLENFENSVAFTRSLNITASNSILKMKIAPVGTIVKSIGEGANLVVENDFIVLEVEKHKAINAKIFISGDDSSNFNKLVSASSAPEELTKYTKGGGRLHYPETLRSPIVNGSERGIFAIDVLNPPFDNPWNARMKLSGIDFMNDKNNAVVCTTDGDVWFVSGLIDGSKDLEWQRIGSGLFQPLGIKVVDENIYVICRDQIVLLRDFNGDKETDFYESFNHDHQVTDHFHEFAMGLQVDQAGNFYYAKSGRHAREALIPQHGTLLKVSKDGSKTEIAATGFRAANGVCINPDGSFIVTDQQGYWNPMNRINWVETGGKAKFYGNMWGYNPPKDSSRTGMEQPMVWVDMEFDRSPSELLWVESEAWGPLNGSLLSFSYGYGKIQLVFNESVNGQRQGGVIDLPDIKFLTGVMRGRFNSDDGNLYACGMSAWGTSQLMKGGGLYRIRYTGKTLTIPVDLNIQKSGVKLVFATKLDAEKAQNVNNFKIETWNLKRSKKYGSDRFDRQTISLSKSELLPDGRSILLHINDLTPIDVMTIEYEILDAEGVVIKGKLQNTIHNIGS